MDLTDKQWALIESLFETKRRGDGQKPPTEGACRLKISARCLH